MSFIGLRPGSKSIVPLICCILVFLKGFGSDVLFGAPINRLLERSICRHYYESHSPGVFSADEEIDEKLCKLGGIQTELALILGTAGFLSPLVELIVALPLAICADKWGRRAVLYLNVASGLCYYGWVVITCFFDQTFRPFATVGCAIFYFIGGGPSIFSAMVLAIIADVTPEDSRTKVFYYVQCIVQVVQMISPLVGSFLVTVNVWAPFYLGIVLQLGQYLLVPFLPQTRADPRANISPPPDEEDLLLPRGINTTSILNCSGGGNIVPTRTALPTRSPVLGCSVLQALPSIRYCAELFFQNTKVALMLAGFFVTTLGRSFIGTLLQYVSIRYDWTLAHAGYLLSLKSLTSMLLFLLILPGVTTYFSKFHGVSVRKINLTVARVSIALLAAGSMLVGISTSPRLLIPGLIVVSLGSGFSAAMQSLITSMVDKDRIVSLYSAISVIQTIGAMFIHPVLSAALATGIQIGGLSLGLPFFVCSGSYILAAIPLWCIKLSGAMQ